MWSILILFSLLSLVQFIYIATLTRTKKTQQKKISSVSRRKFKFILLGVITVLYLLLFTQLFAYHQPQPITEMKYAPTAPLPTLAPGVIQMLGSRQTSIINNLYFLYYPTDKSQATLSQVAMSLRQQYCQNLCIINIYDATDAYQYDLERVNITSNDVMIQWNKKNYIYVADHYLGYLDAVPHANFNYYPFHDGYYNRAKAGKE